MTFIPVITVQDLATYLGDSSINEDRAALFIEQAQQLCETVISPLPDNASIVVMRVAGRAYTSVTSPRQAPLAASNVPTGSMPGGMGAVWLSRYDKADLRRMNTGSNAFSINMLPAGYGPSLPMWDVNTDSTTLSTS